MLNGIPTSISRRGGALAVVGVMLCTPVAIAGGEEPPQGQTEIFRGVLASMGTVATGVNTSLNVHITGWTTAAQRQVLVNALMSGEEGENSLFNLLRSQPEKGFLQIRNNPGTVRLKYAWQSEEDGKRIITVIADDLLPPMIQTAAPRNYARRYTIVHLELDADGTGTGSAALSASLRWDGEAQRLLIGIESTEPIRISSVRKVQ